MASTSVAPFATGASPSLGAKVAFLASIDFNGQTVPINTGDVTQGFTGLSFSLSNPVDIGSINNFIDYLQRTLGVPLTSAELTNFIDQIPDTPAVLLNFKNTLLSIFSTDLIITVLNVNVGAGTFQLGVAFPIKLELTSFLTINTIGVTVTKGSVVTSP